ncbi:basic proline-rich protein-like [Anser cygnoides]|uniref:basic proline-rich protein-like n=1 Tax=Anser cygnoides TaxID=8845 RepID=UPI0034D1D0A6
MPASPHPPGRIPPAPNPHGSHPRPPRAVLPGIRPLPPPPPPRAARGPPHRPCRSGARLPPLPSTPPPAPGPRRGPATPGAPHPGPSRLLCCCRRPAAEHGRSGSSGPSSGRLLPLPASLTASPGLGRSGKARPPGPTPQPEGGDMSLPLGPQGEELSP